MTNTSPSWNPAYSTIQTINLGPINIARQNIECIFEKLELVENVNDVFPNGVLIVKDTKDIISFIKKNLIDKFSITFFNGNTWTFDITSVSAINNAASDTEENFVGIYFSNLYYKKAQKTSLSQLLQVRKPNVYLVHDFIKLVREKVFNNAGGYADLTSNYVLYKALNTIDERQEAVSDNPIEYLNYLASSAVGEIPSGLDSGKPNFMFWTEFDGSVNFKYFHRPIQDDPNFNSQIKIAVYSGDSVIQKLSDGKVYRKAYYLNTNPAYQFISKNYYYIKKTPKVLDTVPPNADENYETQCLMYQFQDEGQKYNIEVVDAENRNQSIPGADQLFYANHWGYFDGLDSVNDSSYHAHIGQKFGTDKKYNALNIMGQSGFMQYVDTTEMWKNMFDMTEVHPHYPDANTFNQIVPGESTNLQKVIDIRYNSFLSGLSGSSGACGSDRLELIRKIELQNFIMYSLCCMGAKDDESFFAALLKYEEDNKCPTGNEYGKKYRYKWSKLTFEGLTGSTGGLTGASGASGASGGTGDSCGELYFHQVERWKFDSLQSSPTQDETWAINLNERGLTSGYIPPGFILDCALPTFKLRPVGAKAQTVQPSEDIFHIVKMYRHTDGDKYFYYFAVENAFDGCCDS